MSQLIIVGARAMGRETCSYAQEAGMSVKGFLDSATEVLDGFDGYPPVLGSVEEYKPQPNDVFVCALGDPAMKRKYVELVSAKGARFESVIHPMAYIGKNVKIGDGSIICPHATITNDAIVGLHVIVNANASINHDNRIGDYSTICPGCRLAGRVKIGAGVFVGTGATLIPDVVLGDDVMVAAGAVVTRSFESGRLMGVPAAVK